MLTISKPLSASQAQSYHAEEFGNARENYYTEADQIRGEWHGRLAEEWGLRGEVREEHFERLSEGQHPITGEQLIRHQAAREYMNRRGEKVSAMEHRAGWDATFSAPKSVSLTAFVGGDDVRDAHRKSVRVALQELDRYTQARIGNVHLELSESAPAVRGLRSDRRPRPSIEHSVYVRLRPACSFAPRKEKARSLPKVSASWLCSTCKHGAKMVSLEYPK